MCGRVCGSRLVVTLCARDVEGTAARTAVKASALVQFRRIAGRSSRYVFAFAGVKHRSAEQIDRSGEREHE
jgi:hypothetical protein